MNWQHGGIVFKKDRFATTRRYYSNMLWTQPGALSDASDDINYHPLLGLKLLNLASIIEIKCMLIRMAYLTSLHVQFMRTSHSSLRFSLRPSLKYSIDRPKPAQCKWSHLRFWNRLVSSKILCEVLVFSFEIKRETEDMPANYARDRASFVLQSLASGGWADWWNARIAERPMRC